MFLSRMIPSRWSARVSGPALAVAALLVAAPAFAQSPPRIPADAKGYQLGMLMQERLQHRYEQQLAVAAAPAARPLAPVVAPAPGPLLVSISTPAAEPLYVAVRTPEGEVR